MPLLKHYRLNFDRCQQQYLPIPFVALLAGRPEKDLLGMFEKLALELQGQMLHLKPLSFDLLVGRVVQKAVILPLLD